MLLIAIVVMAYVLSLREAFESGSLKQKVYRDGSSSMAVSFFRQGITRLRRYVKSLVLFIRYLESIAQTLRTSKWVYVQQSAKFVPGSRGASKFNGLFLGIRQANRLGEVVCVAATSLGGGAQLCLAEFQPSVIQRL